MSSGRPPITDDRAREFYVHAYAWDMGDTPSPGQERAREVQAREWDRWLAAHDARVRRDAAREALDGLADHVDSRASFFLSPTGRPRRAQDVLDYRDTHYPNTEETP